MNEGGRRHRENVRHQTESEKVKRREREKIKRSTDVMMS